MTVIEVMVFATVALYEVVAEANAGLNVPEEIVKVESVATVEFGTVIESVSEAEVLAGLKAEVFAVMLKVPAFALPVNATVICEALFRVTLAAVKPVVPTEIVRSASAMLELKLLPVITTLGALCPLVMVDVVATADEEAAAPVTVALPFIELTVVCTVIVALCAVVNPVTVRGIVPPDAVPALTEPAVTLYV